MTEVNATEDWLIRCVFGDDGKFVLTKDRQEIKTERIEGKFRIELKKES